MGPDPPHTNRPSSEDWFRGAGQATGLGPEGITVAKTAPGSHRTSLPLRHRSRGRASLPDAGRSWPAGPRPLARTETASGWRPIGGSGAPRMRGERRRPNAPEAVWSIASDITRVGEWSGECRGCAWVEGSTSATPGARFWGRNRRGAIRWTRLSEVRRAEPPRALVWRTVPSGPYPDSVEWQIAIDATPGGCRVTEAFRMVKLPRLMELGIPLVMPSHADRSADLADDLNRLKRLVEGATA